MRQKTYTVLIIGVYFFVFYLFFSLYQSSLWLEQNKARANKPQVHLDTIAGIGQKNQFFYNTYIQNPANLELYLRVSLVHESNTGDLIQGYLSLLQTRPSWPYYFSGLAQVNYVSKTPDFSVVNQAIKYGLYEKTVVNSLAELLFYQWEKLQQDERMVLMSYLAQQQETQISSTINIAAKFAKTYEYCDFLYAKNHKQYNTCKQNYWQPLSD